MISDALIQKFSQAIARAEGFYTQGSVPQRSNNPGDLGNGDIGNGVVQTGGPQGVGVTVYSNVTDGWIALSIKLRRMFAGASEVYLLSMSVEEMGMKWSGDPNWGKNVAEFLTPVGALAVTADTTLAEIAQADLQSQGTENVT